jgi:hypothetical protein
LHFKKIRARGSDEQEILLVSPNIKVLKKVSQTSKAYCMVTMSEVLSTNRRNKHISNDSSTSCGIKDILTMLVFATDKQMVDRQVKKLHAPIGHKKNNQIKHQILHDLFIYFQKQLLNQ